MIKIIRSTLFVTIALALGACNLLSPPTTTNSLIADLPALGLAVQVQNSTDIFNTVGQVINYNYVITYTASAALAGPVTVLDLQSAVTCPDLTTVGNLNSSLDQNETVICKSSYSITQADLNLGSVTKNATASVGGSSSNPASVVAAMAQNKSLTLTTSANPTTYNQLNQIITYTYVIKNSGNVTLGPAQFTVTDNHISAPTNCGSDATILLPTEMVTCTATYSTVQADLNTGLVTNSATASGGGVGPSQPASATVNNSNVIQATPNPSSANLSPGATIQHAVVAGEWLIQIARCYGASFADVRNANPQITDPNVIAFNTTVTVPRIGSVGKIYGPPCVGTHTVQTGDTWSSIAQRYNADILALQAVNHGVMSVGSVIKVPLNSSGGVISSPASTEPTRINFAQGATSTTLNGTLDSLGTVRYAVNANQGQVMSVTLTSTPASEVAMSIYSPSGAILKALDANLTWSGTLPANGDYRIEIINILGSLNKSYTLVVSITTP